MDTRKALALLAYLTITGEHHSREKLAALFWPDSDRKHALASLRRTLSSLRGGLDEKNLDISRKDLGLAAEADLWLDVDRFQAAIKQIEDHQHTSMERCSSCMSALREAEDLYRGDFMDGFNLRAVPEFDEWRFYEADRLQRRYAFVLKGLVEAHARIEDYPKAIDHAAQWLAIDQLHEPAHRWLMKLHSWSGQRNAALKQYRRCLQILEQELGVDPTEETKELYRAVLENSMPALPEGKSEPIQHEQPTAPAVAGPDTFPMVGRRIEWQALTECHEKAQSGGYLVGIQGEAGVGKTRLVQEFGDQLGVDGEIVVSARCYPGERELPFSPIANAIRGQLVDGQGNLSEFLDRRWLFIASRLLPELAPEPSGGSLFDNTDDPAAQSRLFESLARLLSALLKQGSGPGMFFLDDMHWVDPTTLDFVHYLARRLGRFPHLIILTWRGRDRSLQSSLGTLLTEARRQGRGHRMVLSRLSEEDVGALVESQSISHEEKQDLIERLLEESEGLPFFIVNQLYRGQGESAAEWPLPTSALELLHSKLEGIDEVAEQVLQAGAVLGRSSTFHTLRAVSGRSEEEVVTSIEMLIKRGLLQESERREKAPSSENLPSTDTIRYEFSHEKFRQGVNDELSLARQRILHKRAAQVLAKMPEDGLLTGDQAAAIANHYLIAGIEDQAAEYFKRAGDYARSIFANKESLEHYQRALALGYEPTARLHESIGELQVLLGEYERALANFERASTALEEPADLADICYRTSDLHQRRGEWGLARTHVEQGLAFLADPSPSILKVKLHCSQVQNLLMVGELDRALLLAAETLESAEALDHPAALARVHHVIGRLHLETDDTASGIEHLERAKNISERADEPHIKIAVLNSLALIHTGNGSYDDAIEAIGSALVVCRRIGDRHLEAALLNNLADIYHDRGDSEQSMAALKKAVKLFNEIGVDSDRASAEIWKLRQW